QSLESSSPPSRTLFAVSITRAAGARSALTAAFATVLLGMPAQASSSRTSPVLGHVWAPNQMGYGEPRPVTVYNGGDSTGLVRQIRWTGWGRTVAVGYGISTYVWPGTTTADNGPIPGARIVAFHLGTCHGQPSYNAVTWYFP